MSSRNVRAARRARSITARLSEAANPVFEPLELRRLLSATLNGVVFSDANMDGSQNFGEAGLAGIAVNVVDGSGATLASTTTDGSGNYSISGLPTGASVTVSVNLPGYVTLYADASGDASAGNQSLSLADGPNTVRFAEYRTLGAPTELTAVAASGSEVDLSWASNSGGSESGFHVYESVNGGAFSSTPVASTTTNVTSCPITGLDSANDYVFTVAAYDTNGDSAPAGPSDAAAPPAPTDVETAALLDLNGNGSVEVDWAAGTGTPSGVTYDIFRSTDGSIPSAAYATGITGSSFTDTAVAPGGTYFYFVKAISGAALSGGSTPSSGATSGPQTGVPTDEGTICYYRFASVLAQSGGDIVAADSGTAVPVHPFNPALGTATAGLEEFNWRDAITEFPSGNSNYDFAWHDSDGPTGGNMQGQDDELDNGSVVADPANPFSDFHTAKGFSARALPSSGFVTLEAQSFMFFPDGNSMELALAGYICTLYHYTTAAPTVNTSPSSQLVAAGSTATFTAAASGSPAPAVQWQKSTDAGATWTAIPGATSTTYSFTAAAGDNGSRYEAVFTNSAGTVTTSPATLTVTAAPPTLSGAPVINGDDPNGLYTASGQPANGKQRSMVEDVVYTFNEPVLINDANAAFTVAVAGPAGGTVPSTLYAQAVAGSNGTQWAVSLTGQPEGTLASIANGEYSITINPAYVFAAADGMTSMEAGTGRTDTFYRLYGDINKDLVVNLSDEFKFNQAMNTYNAAFDVNGDGVIDATDQAAFQTDFQSGGYVGDGFVTTI